jgi:Flp pilus assembly protein CpaB
VLGIAQVVDQTAGATEAGDTATLEASPKEAEILALGATMGTLSLSLHGEDPGVHPELGNSYTSDLNTSYASADLIGRLLKGESLLPATAGDQDLIKVFRGTEEFRVWLRR